MTNILARTLGTAALISTAGLTLTTFDHDTPTMPSTTTHEQINTTNKMLLILAAPDVDDPYYESAFQDIVDFQINYAQQVLEHGQDDIRILVSQATRPSYATLPGEILIDAPMLDIRMRDFTTTNPHKPVQRIYTDASMSAGQSRRTQQQFNQRSNVRGLPKTQADYYLDGGNIVDNYAGKVITTTRLLDDNDLSYDQGVAILQKYLDVDAVAIIEPDDEVLAHADGMVARVEEDVLLVNDYSDDPSFRDSILQELQQAFPGVTIIEVPVSFDTADDRWGGINSACGITLNAVVTHNAIYIPTFGGMDHEIAATQLIRHNTNKQVILIDASQVCSMGGSVRCMTWQLAGEHTQSLLQHYIQ